MPNINSKLFLDPQLTYPAGLAAQDFSQYIAACKKIIAATRQDLAGDLDAATIIDANAPFECHTQATPSVGALLVHGLYDSPFIMRDLATHLQTVGIQSRALLLPGHGTVPGALLHVRYTDWVQTVEQGLKGLAQNCEKIWLVGFSTGASLALLHAVKKIVPQIAGIILIAPALKISALSVIAPIMPCIGMPWYHQAAEIDYTKYESFTFNSVTQLRLLMDDIWRNTQTSITCPMLMVLSAADQTISSGGAQRYFQHFANADSQLIIYGDNKNITNPNIQYRNPANPSLQIQSLSHVALPIAPANPHYGQHGDYPGASRLTTDKNIIYGSVSDLSQAKNYLYQKGIYPKRYERLTYNPDFACLQHSVSDFILKNR